ncbi:MAG: hypothetical protein HY704_08615 [Gemmatimonadetes bacterium]|nr:hypothetical protein [Gemmatimonadota bacterium]
MLLAVDEQEGGKVVARYDADPALVLEGFVHDSDLPALAGRPLVVVQPVGRGRVVYFADSATFWGYWYGLNTLFLNALLFGPLS